MKMSDRIGFDRFNWRRLAFCMATLFCAILISASLFSRPALLEIHVLDVGQGDAILVRSAEQILLIDAGTNMAEEYLNAFLHSMGIKRIDVFICTHPDEDHIGGADAVLYGLEVSCLYLPAIDSNDENFTKLLIAAAETGTVVRIAEVGERFSIGEAEVQFLGPLALDGETNNASIITRITCGNTSALLMGDAELAAETALLGAWSDDALDVDLLKLGHHGASTSTSAALLEAVTPRFAAISCGAGNDYGHPARSTIDALLARGIAVGRTDRDGRLIYCSDGTRFWRKK